MHRLCFLEPLSCSLPPLSLSLSFLAPDPRQKLVPCNLPPFLLNRRDETHLNCRGVGRVCGDGTGKLETGELKERNGVFFSRRRRKKGAREKKKALVVSNEQQTFFLSRFFLASLLLLLASLLLLLLASLSFSSPAESLLPCPLFSHFPSALGKLSQVRDVCPH